MNSPSVLHERIMREYQNRQDKNRAIYKEKLQEIYNLFPRVKQIDDEISLLSVKHATRIITENISPEEAVNAVKAEKSRLNAEKQTILSSADIMEPCIETECKLCADTGYVEGEKCKCYMEIMRRFMTSKVDGTKNVNLDFTKDTFDKFSFEWYSKNALNDKINISPYENMKAVYNECVMFCKEFDTVKKNLYFYGSSGTGKTFMANCIASNLLKEGHSVVYYSAYKLFQFMEDYKFLRIDRESNIHDFDSIYNCDLLIIDDLGTEFGSGYTCSVFFDILNTRLLNEKSTIISSNLTLGNLEKKYTERVASRIIGNFEVMRFLGDDIRITKKRIGR